LTPTEVVGALTLAGVTQDLRAKLLPEDKVAQKKTGDKMNDVDWKEEIHEKVSPAKLRSTSNYRSLNANFSSNDDVHVSYECV